MPASVLRRAVRPGAAPRRGAILVLATAVLILIFAFAAFTLDVGWISLTKSQLQSAVDAAALSAAQELNPNGDQTAVAAAVRTAAADIAALHRGGEKSQVELDPNTDVLLGRRTWDPVSGTYSYAWGPTAIPYNLVKVVALRGDVPGPADRSLPLFFAPVIGHDKATVRAEAVATFVPRDMMLVLDYSASMNDDSEFGAFDRLGRTAVEANMLEMWQDLGSPVYGNLAFEPDWVTIPGRSASGSIPHIDVTYKKTSIYVKSTMNLSSVRLTFSGGSSQTFSGLSSKTGTFQGTGSYSGRQITSAQITSGSNGGEQFAFDAAAFKKGLGLSTLSYPHPEGSWDEFIQFATYDPGNTDAGYSYKFGMMNLIAYWTQYRPGADETPGLWKASQQPLTALKDSADVFLQFLSDVKADDQVGFTLYTSDTSSGAKLESALSYDYAAIKTLYRQRQAGHYNQYTNIGAGLRSARLELESHARDKALRMIILMTDGLPNLSSTSASPTQFVLDEAALCKAANIKVMTISLGSSADVDLMQQVADATGGKHFNVPGGANIADLEAQLKAAFSEIAADRPMQLIQP